MYHESVTTEEQCGNKQEGSRDLSGVKEEQN